MYTTRWCGYCVRAKALLDSRGLEFDEVSLDDDPSFRQRHFDLTGSWTVPQIVIDDRPIGGYTELWRLDRAGACSTSCSPPRERLRVSPVAGSAGGTASGPRARGGARCRSAGRRDTLRPTRRLT